MNKRIIFPAKANTLAPAMSDGDHVPLSIDPSDGGLRVHVENGGVGGGGGTEYTEGAADASITGTAIMWEDAADTLRAVSAAKPLPVEVISGGGSGSNAAAGSTGSAVPSSADYQGVNVGGNLQGAAGFDLDTGAGSEYVQGVSMRKSASGGSVEAGTLADPLRVDPTGTTTQPVSGTVTAQLAAGTNNIGDVDVLTLPALPAGTNNIGDVDVLTLPSLPAGNNNIGDVDAIQSGTWTVQPGNTPNSTPWLVTQKPATSGGLSISRVISAASTNATSAKGSAGQVFGWVITNTNASVRYVKLYNKSSAPTVGTDTPVMTLAIPGNAAGAGMVAAEFVNGIEFSSGVAYATTTGAADSDTGAVGANEIIINLLYK